MLFLFNINVFADIYKSRVFDELGHPIIGCSVTNLETGIVTYTDSEGKFSIKTAKYDSIRFSHPHYKSKEISCEKKIKTIILKDIINISKAINIFIPVLTHQFTITSHTLFQSILLTVASSTKNIHHTNFHIF